MDVDDPAAGTERQLCTYAVGKDNLINQAIYICNTCSKHSATNTCCCTGCATTCHDGHDVNFLAYGKAYCDCGHGGCALIEQSTVEALRLFGARTGSEDGIKFDDSGHIAGTASSGLHLPNPFEATMIQGIDDTSCYRDDCISLAKLSKETFWLSAECCYASGEEDSQSDSGYVPELVSKHGQSKGTDEIGIERSASLVSPLENMARKIFLYHTRGIADKIRKQLSRSGNSSRVDMDTDIDIDTCGAEWWVQVKRVNIDDRDVEKEKDSTGARSNGDKNLQMCPAAAIAAGVDLHYDKDEEVAAAFGLGVFPQISTVTYLTDDLLSPIEEMKQHSNSHSCGIGISDVHTHSTAVIRNTSTNVLAQQQQRAQPQQAQRHQEQQQSREKQQQQQRTQLQAPTVVFEVTASDVVGKPLRACYVSWPEVGKHISFDGRLLHGAPAQLKSFYGSPLSLRASLPPSSSYFSSSPPPCSKIKETTKLGADMRGPINGIMGSISGNDPTFTNRKPIPAIDFNSTTTDSAASIAATETYRVTFLVNIWLNHKPAGVQPLPSHIRSQLSPVHRPSSSSSRSHCHFSLNFSTTSFTTAAAAVADGGNGVVDSPPASMNHDEDGYISVGDEKQKNSNNNNNNSPKRRKLDQQKKNPGREHREDLSVLTLSVAEQPVPIQHLLVSAKDTDIDDDDDERVDENQDDASDSGMEEESEIVSDNMNEGSEGDEKEREREESGGDARDVRGSWEQIPFVSDKSEWGKAEEESALSLYMWFPSAEKVPDLVRNYSAWQEKQQKQQKQRKQQQKARKGRNGKAKGQGKRTGKGKEEHLSAENEEVEEEREVQQPLTAVAAQHIPPPTINTTTNTAITTTYVLHYAEDRIAPRLEYDMDEEAEEEVAGSMGGFCMVAES